MNKSALNFNIVLYYIILILPLVWLKQVFVLGENILPLLMIALEVVLICKKILDNKGKKFIIRSYSMDKYICFFIMVYVLWKILSFSMGFFPGKEMDMEFYTTVLAVTMLYLFMDFRINVNPKWQQVASLSGTIGSLIIFLSSLNRLETEQFRLTDALTEVNNGIVSYLLLVNLLCISNWIFRKETDRWSNVWLILTGFNMFVLLLNQSHISNWIIVFVLLSLASFSRPRALLIKKIGILLFLFLFLWSNMSLILNYTEWFQVKAVYSLESSVYMELVLALGGLLFFHFWDRIPEGYELQKISMVKMQYYFRMVLGVLIFVFFMFSMGGNEWNFLEDKGVEGFIKFLALPLSSEITTGGSTIFQGLTKLGVIGVVLLFLWFYQLGIRLYKKCGVDNESANFVFIYYSVFLMQLFMWEVPGNVLFVYVFLISTGNVKQKLIEIEIEDEM